MPIRFIAVDDEPLSLRIIEKYAAALPQLELMTTCADAFIAMEVLQREQVDLIFLDINMPKLSGISMVKALTDPPIVIFTTAYPEYAVEGFELEAVDYLVKPFSLERFIKAVNRAGDKLRSTAEGRRSPDGHLLIKADRKIYRIEYADIRYLEAYGDYVKVYTHDKMLLTKERLSNLEKGLPEKVFFKIHRSYVISLDALDFVEGNRVKIGQANLPVSASCRDQLMERLRD